MVWNCFNVLRKGNDVPFKIARLCWRVSPGLAQWVNDVGEGLAYYRMRRWAHSHSEAKATGFLAVGLIPGLIALDYRGRSDEWLWGYLSDALSIAGHHSRLNEGKLTDIELARLKKLMCELRKEEHGSDADAK
jgi:hypothetical protein